MKDTTVFADFTKKEVGIFFSHSPNSLVSPVGASIVLTSQEEGLLLADQIRNATLAVWPVEVENTIKRTA